MKTIIMLGLSALASAHSNIVTMLLPNINVEPYAASIVNEDTAATTYAVSCGSGSNHCGGMPAFTAVQGSETAAYSFSLTASDVLVSYGCSVAGTTTAVCSEAVTGTGAESPGVSSFTLGASDIQFMLVPVTVAAGSITQGASGTAASASTVSTASVASATSTAHGVSTTSGAASTATHTSSESSTGATMTSPQSSASTKASTGGSMPLMTGNVQAVVGGAMLALVAAGL
ncbi:hypothetical protein TMatcc_000216 [Talaromyces marneffei ATCC 18224]|uniref:GPI anchored protein n=1 Tax=Talaromyces marneffei (strain ATCC 18224 / CBS 334.59 / QM 7333) TaxID=441960 RepID=B6QQ90_TALMQ|nr:uncharacterized protein EYB26_005295 [Talaromyces marneffei]EEA20233.1 conserved hypothetical protein [Talaromyces marneffei ATCC 18224]KAE8549242.1 hypothetical protein EYB25_007762 [Talaromyces marneffei]QGA17620.1 hypothetical protein EYB26_005295 [Talaromyces marneffei]